MPAIPFRAVVSERQRIKEAARIKTPLLTEETMEGAIREFAKGRTKIPPFGFHHEVGHVMLRDPMNEWMKTHSNIQFSPEEKTMLRILQGSRANLPDEHSDRKKMKAVVELLLQLPKKRGKTVYTAFQKECARLAKISARVQRQLAEIPGAEEHRQPHTYASMFTNPLLGFAMVEDLHTLKELL